MKISIMSALLLISFLWAHAQATTSTMSEPTNIPKTTHTGAAASYETQFNLGKDYKGDSLPALITKLEKIENAKKDEFIKASERDRELSSFQARQYRFVVSTETNTIVDKVDIIGGFRYDADGEVIRINLWVNNEDFIFHQERSVRSFPFPQYTTLIVAKDTRRGSYIGQNAFGARAKVSSTVVTEFGLVLANVSQERNSAVFSLSLPALPQNAKNLKKDLAFYVDVQLTKSETLKGIVLGTTSGHDATFRDPSEFYVSGKYLLVNVKEIGVYRKSTGEVLGSKKFEIP